MNKVKTWLVTGSARGLGRHIAEAVLAAGDHLVAAARDPSRLADLQKRYGERIRTAALDVTDAAAAQAAVRVAIEAFGRLDVLVNNVYSSEFYFFGGLRRSATLFRRYRSGFGSERRDVNPGVYIGQIPLPGRAGGDLL